jgi:hypothetical protein
MQTNSFQKNVKWRPIHPLLAKIDSGDVSNRLVTLRNTCYGKSPVEIHMQFDPATIGEAAEMQFSKGTRAIEGIRNASVFAPLMLMLFSLGVAAQAYAQLPHATTNANGTTFFNTWINGFPTISSVKILGWQLSLIIGKSHWFTFSDILISDFILLIFIIGLTIIVQLMEGHALKKARKLTVWLNEEFSQLCNASYVKSLGVGPGSEQPEWAVHVHEAIYNLHQVLQGVEGSVDTSQKKFSDTIEKFTDVYNKQNLAVDQLLRGTRETEETVDKLGGIYIKLYEASQLVANVLPTVSTQLAQMVSNQEQMTRQLKSMTDDIHQLARPFQTVGLAEMAHQLDKQQKENLSFLKKTATRGWLRKLFSH